MVFSDCDMRLDQVGRGIAEFVQKFFGGMKKFRACLGLSLLLNLVSWLGPYIFYNVNTTRSYSQSERLERMDLNIQAYLASNYQNKCNHLWEIKTEDGWFEDNFKSSLKPMWTARRENISQEVFMWWNSLSSSNNTYKLVYDLAKELTAATPEDVPDPPESKTCIRCAVVGNSGNLKQSGYGHFIDNHNIIVRMNHCPTKGYEKDVGSRTTHYVAYPSSYRESDLAKASLVFAAFNLEDLKWLKEKVTPNQTKSNNDHQYIDKERVFLLNPELMWHIKHQWGLGKGRWASTGLLSIFVALQMCDEVDIFGFGANHLGYWDHYFENNNGEQNSAFIHTLVHDKDAETDLLHRLIKSKAITMFRGFR